MSTPYKVTAQFWDHATLWSDDESMAGHSTDGGRVFGITRTRYVECDHYKCPPVAVIAYEDREQVDRLRSEIFEHTGIGHREFDRVQAALRVFANPTPPKPAEPTGLGAVVEDADGAKWIRSDDTDCANPWHQNGTFTDREYAEIDAVRVLSEGVLPGVEPLADWEIDLLRGAE